MVVLLFSLTLQACKDVEGRITVVPPAKWIPYLEKASRGFPMGVAVDSKDLSDVKGEPGRPSYANGSVFVVQTYFNGE